MKRILILVMLFAFVLSSVSFADNALTKLGRGTANVVTSPFEITKNMGEVKEKDGIFAGLTTGLFKGIFDTGKRLVVGVYEIATFPLPLPSGYKPIITDPEYIMKPEHELRTDL